MNTVSLTLNPRDRLELSTTIQRLIDLLDAMESDPDLECSGDDEPSYGAPERHPHPGLWGGVCEPTCSQELWAQGGDSDLEQQCDDEGAPDYHDDAGLLIWGGNEDSSEARR